MAHATFQEPGTSLRLPPLSKGAHSSRLNLIAVVATFGGLLFGYDTGVLNGSLSYMTDYFGLSPLQEGFITFSLLTGATIGAFAGGRISDRVGRRPSIVMLGLVFLVGTLGCVLAPTYSVLLVFRVILGLAVGGASVTVPVYLSEVAPVEMRGSMIGRNDVMIVSGQFLAFLFNAVIGNVWGGNDQVWRVMLAIAALPAIVLFFGMQRMPESPRWLVSRGRHDEALKVLQTVRPRDRAIAEMEEVRELARLEAATRTGGWSDVFSQRWMFRLLIAGIALSALAQLTGINTVMYYGTQVLEQAGFARNTALIFNVLNGVVSVGAMLIGVAIVNRVGRRSMLLAGYGGCALLLIFIGGVGAGLSPTETSRPYLLTAGLVTFMGLVQATVTLVTWVVLSEMFPLRMRGLMIGVSIAVLWLTNALVSLVFPPVVQLLDFSTFFLFAICCIVGVFFVHRHIPETRGKSLETIEEEMIARWNHGAPVQGGAL